MVVPSRLSKAADERDEVVIGSIGPTTDRRSALADAEAVVHLAARVHHPHEEYATALYP